MIKAIGYFIEIIKGSLLTTRHFVVNMWFHTLKLFRIKTRRKGAVTIQYPEEKERLHSGIEVSIGSSKERTANPAA